MKEYKELLASVSRSFYLSMCFLPGRVRPGIACAYLLARATDTVADSSSRSVEDRLAMLAAMKDMIMGDRGTFVSSCLNSLQDDYAEGLTHPGESRLLQRFDECLQWLDKLPEDQAALVRTVLETIIDGQSWDLDYFDGHTCVDDRETLNLYTYRVAGCVGEFWTMMLFDAYGDRFALVPVGTMKKWGVLYGQGLQLVNILRDRDEDCSRGRCYIPRDDHVEAFRYWINMARFYLKQGLLYSRALAGWRARFSTILPLLLGFETLDLIEFPKKGQTKAKVSRRTVYRLMFKAMVFALKKPRLSKGE